MRHTILPELPADPLKLSHEDLVNVIKDQQTAFENVITRIQALESRETTSLTPPVPPNGSNTNLPLLYNISPHIHPNGSEQQRTYANMVKNTKQHFLPSIPMDAEGNTQLEDQTREDPQPLDFVPVRTKRKMEPRPKLSESVNLQVKN